MLIAVLHLIPDEDDPWRIVASFMDAVPSGKPVRAENLVHVMRPGDIR